jgi:hypothetical protein
MVILNGALTDKTLQMDRFSDITGKYTRGRDVITTATIDLTKPVTVPAKGEYILDLEN